MPCPLCRTVKLVPAPADLFDARLCPDCTSLWFPKPSILSFRRDPLHKDSYLLANIDFYKLTSPFSIFCPDCEQAPLGIGVLQGSKFYSCKLCQGILISAGSLSTLLFHLQPSDPSHPVPDSHLVPDASLDRYHLPIAFVLRKIAELQELVDTHA